MLTLTYASTDAELARRLQDDLRAAGFTIATEMQTGQEHILIAVLSPQANADAKVQADIIHALDNLQQIVPVFAAPAPLPELIDHLDPLDFSETYDREALLTRIEELSSPSARLPLRVRTPAVRRANRRAGYVLLVLVIAMFLLGMYTVGVLGIQAPQEEYDAIATEAILTRNFYVDSYLPRGTDEATNFPSTLQAASTALRPVLEATATAVAGE